MTSIPEILEEQARIRPAAAALIATRRGRDETVSFAELADLARGCAEFLRRAGFQKGDALLVLVPMSIELYVILLGLFRLGAVAMFLDPSAGAAHVDACCEMRPPGGFIGIWKAHWFRLSSRRLRAVSQAFLAATILREARRCAHSRAESGEEKIGPEDAALITFTSGSTGQPKAAVRTHGFLIAQYEVLRSAIQLEPGELDLTTLPIFVLANLAAGVTSILPDANLARPGQVNVHRIARQIERLRPSRTGGSPAFYERLAAAAENGEDMFRGFRKIYTGGAPVFPELLERLQRLAPSTEITAVYGSTEAEPIAHLDGREIRREDLAAMHGGRGLLTGQPVREISVRIFEDHWGKALDSLTAAEFAAKSQPVDGAGEIVVHGRHVLSGYLQGRGDHETKFTVDGAVWHRTGDAGYLDPAGRLWLLGRCAAKISDERGVLHPFAVECAAHAHPWIRRTALVLLAQKRVLVIEFEQVPCGSEVKRLKADLVWAKLDQFAVVKNIPVDRRHNAKVDYVGLGKLLQRPFAVI